MWYYANGRTCPKTSWAPDSFTKQIPNGKFYRLKSRDEVAWEVSVSPKLLDILGPELLGLGGSRPTAEALAGRDVVGLYFSAHYCPPCRAFTPQLSLWYGAMWGKRPGALELIFCSRDRDEQSFNEYRSKMPWQALPFADAARRESLAQQFGVSGIPALVLLDSEGNVLLAEGRNHVLGDIFANSFPWPRRSLDEGGNAMLAAGVVEVVQMLLPREVSAAEQQARQEMHGRIMGHAESVMQYEDPLAQALALSSIPLEALDAAARTSEGSRHCKAFVKELLRWFKQDFFTWTDQPPCSFCGGKTSNVGMGQPTPEEQADGAGRVELYQCTLCSAQTRFPRFNKATKLL